jgi:hypothetical protein
MYLEKPKQIVIWDRGSMDQRSQNQLSTEESNGQ